MERAWRSRLSKKAGGQITKVVKCYQGLLSQELAGDLVEGTSGRGRTMEERTETGEKMRLQAKKGKKTKVLD